jgi:hypothetical protein
MRAMIDDDVVVAVAAVSFIFIYTVDERSDPIRSDRVRKFRSFIQRKLHSFIISSSSFY